LKRLFTLNSLIQALTKTVDSKIRICLGCGSAETIKNERTIICRDCGNIRFFQVSSEYVTTGLKNRKK